MKCQKCKKDFPEREIHESHDIPCYLFEGDRKERKNQADKFGRHHLCNECHEKYEFLVLKEWVWKVLFRNVNSFEKEKGKEIAIKQSKNFFS